jgi:hypothetical protein
MTCPKCNSENVLVTNEQIGGKTRTRGTGCLWTLGRWLLIVCTLGLWLLIGKRKRTSKTKFENRTVAICQNCGNRWNV